MNDDLISRQAAIDALKRDEEYDEDIPNRADGVRDAIITIMGLPSAQPELIHCRDCKWHNGEINQCSAQICASMRGDDFCSRAERRTDETD